MSQSGYVHLDHCRVVHTTGAAILVEYEDEEVWLPKSQVADPETYSAGDDDVTVSITEWVAKQKGLWQ